MCVKRYKTAGRRTSRQRASIQDFAFALSHLLSITQRHLLLLASVTLALLAICLTFKLAKRKAQALISIHDLEDYARKKPKLDGSHWCVHIPCFGPAIELIHV
jgi:hypothetical protein